jgi:hypothetical protein
MPSSTFHTNFNVSDSAFPRAEQHPMPSHFGIKKVTHFGVDDITHYVQLFGQRRYPMPYELTRDGLVSALTPQLLPQTRPTLLRDVIAMKRERGDTDIAAFRSVCHEFAHGINGTISGGIWAMNQMIKSADAGRQPWIGAVTQARRRAFVADCEAVLAGTFGVDFRAVA